MEAPNRLPLVKHSLALLLSQLDANDRGRDRHLCRQGGIALEPTAATDKARSSV